MTPIDTGPWPRFRCYKAVKAVQITRIAPAPEGAVLMPELHELGRGPEPRRLFFMEQAPQGDPVERFYDAPANMFARGLCQVGDYLVQYDDGYISISPKQAFEAGYFQPQAVSVEARIEPFGGKCHVMVTAKSKDGYNAGWSGVGHDPVVAIANLVEVMIDTGAPLVPPKPRDA